MRSSSHSSGEHRVVKTACEMCWRGCGLDVYVENGKIVKVEGMSEHPYTRGDICVKARQIVEHVYHKDRLQYPMKKENGSWKRISWDEALDTIATKLTDYKEKYGAASHGIFVGDPVSLLGITGWEMIQRFCDAYGTPNRFFVTDLCGGSAMMAETATLGAMWEPDIENSNCIVVWADNPHNTRPTIVQHIVEARKRGAKLIVIDPRRVPIARQADIHLQPRPATDGALALAMLNVIVSEGLYDRGFVEGYAVGFDKLADHVKQYPPEYAERVTGVPAEDIRQTARMYATTKPACIPFGFKLSQNQSGFHTTRCVGILQAITGNVGIPGGSRRKTYVRQRPLGLPELMGETKHVGAAKYPIWEAYGMTNAGCMTNWGDLVLKGEPHRLRTVIVQGANPVVTWPNTPKVTKAFDNLEFVVVMDIFMTETAQKADIVLPACTFLEKLSLAIESAIMLRRPVIQPLFESWSDCKFRLQLAKRMGYGEYFPWRDDEEVVDYSLEPSGWSVKRVEAENPSAILLGMMHPGVHEYKIRGFRTPSGKAELYCQRLKELGYDPLPTFQEPPESPASTPELAKEYPVTLATGTRELEFWHTQHHRLSKLHRRNPEPRAELHPETAAKYGIGDGDIMIVENRIGSIEIKARVTEDILPDTVSVPHAWAEACENMLIDDTPADPVSGFVAFSGPLCRIRKKTLV
ncbi:MAG: molybdopterin-dependent oxidoreductase [Dehalococcoidia bacterium]|nr:molybdopterin-dependent oxidoreductase [Dehalococcoidia bacterium]